MRNQNIEFIGNRKKYFAFSGIVVLVILVFTAMFGVKLDITFGGGTIIDYTYEGDSANISLNEVKTVVEEVLNESVTVTGNLDKIKNRNGFQISLSSKNGVENSTMVQLQQTLQEKFDQQNLQESSIRSVNPTMGMEFLKKCLVAITVGSLLILLYIGLRFRNIGGISAGVFAVIALLHDVFIVFGVFVIFQIPINDSFIAVVLTILGYSINSSIVIYDRIRENESLYRTKSLSHIVNRSLNQTITRGINTTFTTLMAMVVILIVTYISGVTSIFSFVLPMIFGLVSGFYSSTFLASELWVVWKARGNPAVLSS